MSYNYSQAKTPATYPTLVGPFSRMHPHVNIVLALLGEIRVAHLAHVRLNRGVLLHVSGQILVRLNHLVADFAFELRQLVVLLVNVSPQGQLVGELALTNAAPVFHTLFVALHVHPQIRVS